MQETILALTAARNGFARASRAKGMVTALSLAILAGVTAMKLAAQCATVCPPPGFASNQNFAGNPDFEAPGPCGPVAWIANDAGNCMLGGVAWSAAQGWRLHGDNFGRLVHSSWEASTLPIGGLGRMLHIRAKGPESGIFQPFSLPPGAHSMMFSVWVKVVSGQVAIGTNSMVNVGPYAWSTKVGEWEQLRVCTNGSPVDMLFVYNENWATSEGEFYVDRVEVKVIN
jgi:hypothetical protein